MQEATYDPPSKLHKVNLSLLVVIFSHISLQTLREVQAENDSLKDQLKRVTKDIVAQAPVKTGRKARKRDRYAPETDEEVALANLAHWFTMFGYLDVSRRMFRTLFKIHRGEESEDDGTEDDKDGGKPERAGGYDGFGAEEDDAEEDQAAIGMVQEQEKAAVELLYSLLGQNDLLGELDNKSKFMNQVRLLIAFLATQTHLIFIHTP